MGIRGLSSFFNENSWLFTDYKLHDIKVVIDGNNLMHLLYFDRKLDCVYGGEYNKFADSIKSYFDNFSQCNIQPIVLFDGSYDRSDRKMDTVMQRTKDRLARVKHIAKYGHCTSKVLPILAMEVMRDVLRSIGIEFAQCDHEADDQITAIANAYECPVISQDSDFYIFDIHFGFIRLDAIESTVLTGKDSSNKEFKYLNCKIYSIDKFLSHFPGINKNVLPLFGTLMGNDYISIGVFENFFSNIKLPKFKKKKLKVNLRHKKMIGLLTWLESYSVEDAIKVVLSHLKLNRREAVSNVIQQAINSYNIQQCDCRSATSLIEIIGILASEKPVTYFGIPLPDWFIRESRLGNISRFALNAVELQRVFLPSQVEDVSLPSSFVCSKEIRQTLYGILFSDDIEHYSHPVDDVIIVEYGQSAGNLHKESVHPIFLVDNTFGLNRIQNDDASAFLSSALGDKEEYLEKFPESFVLLAGIIRFWVKKSSPKPFKIFFDSLVLHILYFSMLKRNIYSVKKNTLLDDMILGVTESELIFFQNCMKKYTQKPQHNNANPLLLKIIHCFSQLQTCILDILHLNDVLGQPFHSTRVHHFFGGTVLYNLTRDILSRQYPDLFMSQILGRQSKLNEIFVELKSCLLAGLPPDCFVTTECGRSLKRNKKSSQKCRKTKIEETLAGECASNATNNKFQLLSFEFDDVDVLI